MKKLIIFDLDGTLINSIKDLGIATNHALEKNGYAPRDLNEYPMLVGNGVKKLIERALPENARNEKNVETLLSDFKTYYNQHNIDYTRPYEGIPDLLRTLSNRGILIAVASNKYDAAAKK